MFALIVLFTIFLGLVALLAVTEQWQQRRRRKAHSLETNLTQLTAWLEDRGHTLPSVAVVTGLLNRVARREIQSEGWLELQVTGLLPDTQLPQFTVMHILEQTTQYIEFQLGIEWPMCLPGVSVSLVREGGEGREEVTCELQVDWMYVEATVRLTDSGRGVLLGYKHSINPQMALSCLVTTEHVEHSEDVASSVAHALQLMFYQLELTEEEMKTSPPEAHTTVPQNHISPKSSSNSINHNHTSNHTPSVTLPDEQRQSSSPDSHMTSLSPSHSPISQLDGEGGERGGVEGEMMADGAPVVNGASDGVLTRREVDTGRRVENGERSERSEGGEGSEGREEDSTVKEIEKEKIQEENGMEVFSPADHTPSSSAQFTIPDITKSPPSTTSLKTPSLLTIHKHTSLPSLPSQLSKSMSSWRRSPSYEKLQQFKLPSVKEGGGDTTAEEGQERDGVIPAVKEGSSPWPSQGGVEMRRVMGSVGGEGEEEGGEVERHALSLDWRRKSLSISGSAYSVESSGEVYPSLLVFEISDSLRTRHIVALSQAHASKLRKRVTHSRKLHIYNDHIFVATHLKQRFYCHVCKKKIIGFMGKQGYMCRDCHMIVHKQCHCKTEGLCTNSKLSTMNLIYPDSVSTISGL